MATETVELSGGSNTFGRFLPARIRNAFTGTYRRELLRQVDASVLVFDDWVVNLATGEKRQLPDSGNPSASNLAATVRNLLGSAAVDGRVILLLPSNEFVATSVNLPAMTREALISALMLQVDTLLPCFKTPLSVVANPTQAGAGHSTVALWLSENRLEELYRAFELKNLFLTGVMPRSLALANNKAEQQILEEDGSTLTSITLRHGALSQWQQISKQDLEQEIFARQWQHAQQSKSPATSLSINADAAIDIYQDIDISKQAGADYCFIPDSALQARHQQEKGRRVVSVLAILAGAIFLASLPFLSQSFEARGLQAELLEQQNLSSSARQDRQIVQDFEQKWGVITDFPEQQVVQMLFTLQSVLSPDQLTSLELSEGVIRIEGESEEPQAILQRLEQHPMFTEVAFSRATSNSQYYIDLRLSTVNYAGYMVRYFPED